MDLFELEETSINKTMETKPEWTVHTLPIMIKHESSSESRDRTSRSQLHQLEYPTTDSVFTPSMLSGIKQEPPEHNDTTTTVGFTQKLIPVPNIHSDDLVPCAPVKSERISTEDIGISNTNGMPFTETRYESLGQDVNVQPYPVTLYRREGNSIVNVQTDARHDSSSSISDMATCMKTQTGEKPYACSMCGYESKNRCDLVRHIRKHTGEKPYKCSVCGYQFGQKGNLSAHMRTHTGEKSFGCSMCDYRSTTNRDLDRHKRTHTREKSYICSVCGYKCSARMQLSFHLRTHTGEKPFGCSLCDYRCTKNSGLSRHMRKHTGEKPYKCLLCGYQFGQKSHLSRHMRKHTGEKTYKCSVCGYTCGHHHRLLKHMRKHPEEKPFGCSM